MMTNLNAKTLSRLASYLMQVDPDMPISRLRVFLYVAQKQDALVRDLVKTTGLNQSTVARTLAILGDKPQRGGLDGLGWVAMTPDPDDPRRVLINITPKGKRVLSEIEELGD